MVWAGMADVEPELALEGMEEGELQEEAGGQGQGSGADHPEDQKDAFFRERNNRQVPVRTGHGLQITFANSRDLPVISLLGISEALKMTAHSSFFVLFLQDLVLGVDSAECNVLDRQVNARMAARAKRFNLKEDTRTREDYLKLYER